MTDKNYQAASLALRKAINAIPEPALALLAGATFSIDRRARVESFIQLIVIWCSVYLALFAAKKTPFTPVLYFLFFGAIAAHFGLLPEKPSDVISMFSELGIVVIMFALGFEENSDQFIQSIKRSWGIAFFGALAPFIATYYVTWMLWQDKSAAILSGLTMTATAVSLTMVTLKSESLSKTKAATCIMASAVLDDIASLALVAILVPLATSSAEVSVESVLAVSGKAVLFFLLVTVIGAWIFPVKNTRFALLQPVLSKINIRSFIVMDKGEHATLTILVVAVVVGVLAHEFGFHPAIGAYMAGLVLKEEYFDFHGSVNKGCYDETRRTIDTLAFSLIGPIFFVTLGTHLKFDGALFAKVMPGVLLLTASVFVAQVLSAAASAKYTGGFEWPDSFLIGFGMLGRAELAFVVLDIAYIQHQILSMESFYTLLLTAFCLNISVPITIALWKKRFGYLATDEPVADAT